MSELRPETVEQVQEAVCAHETLALRGGGTKTALAVPDVPVLDMSGLQGIIEYEPAEYTFTAYAGTPVRDVRDALAEHGQHMPFDPLLAEAGATLGGTVAANTSGSGRYRYGGVRDFILGVHFVNAVGDVVRGGGKVVKNAAGFDLPKFMTGSMGRYGALVDVTFKVFPQPPAYTTLVAHFATLNAVINAVFELATSPYEMDALDIVNAAQLVIRLGGPAEALPGRVERLQAFISEKTAVSEMEVIDEDAALWGAANSLDWAGDSLVKVPVAPRQVEALDAQLSELNAIRRYTAGANVAWVSTEKTEALEQVLAEMNLSGLQLLGAPGRPYLGNRQGLALMQRVKQALDPNHKFLEI